MSDTAVVPWKEGYYKLQSTSNTVLHVKGEAVTLVNLAHTNDSSLTLGGTWKYGQFGEVKDDIREYTGKTNCNVDVVLMNGFWKTQGVINDDGTKLTIWGANNKLDHFDLMSDEEFIALKEDGDPASAPTHHYKMQPEYQGKLLWVSGAPGLGKSTVGHFLSKTAGYVYYEADAFPKHLNPYIPADAEEPSLATMKQKRLLDVPQERISAVKYGINDMFKMFRGEDYDIDNINAIYTAMCTDIKAERKRIGGDWVIAHAVLTRASRDYIKEQLGPDLLFIVLDMSKEDQIKRIRSRHGEESGIAESCMKLFKMFEPAQADEANVIDVEVTSEMTREEVARKVLDMLPS